MNGYPSKTLQGAVEALSSLPGVGSRSALRLALHLLKQPSENIHHFADSIGALADDVHYCRHCSMISDGDECGICSDPSRDHSLICVVESVRDVMSIEATGEYRGVYHVLGGIISPIDGVGPSDLTISRLTERLKAAEVPVEVILALSGDVEGETTSFYIFRQIEGLAAKVTTLARGLGFGDDLEYADTLTLGRSIANRQLFKP
ncbi:MAG: recombination protein RecR [Bacteroidales bacterium]|nr:recombination protein RecR [Bacteroidales bacterium]MBQ5363996.1 recombination protein RecR [Bacteroidales bacterium]